MAWTQRSPSPNEQGQGNKDPRGESNVHSNYSGNVSTNTPAPDYRDRSGGTGTGGGENKVAPAPAPTPIYASPNEQRPNKPVTTPITSPVITGGNNAPPVTPPPAAIPNPVEVADREWLQDWAESFETGVLDNNKEFQDQLDSSSQGVQNNLGLIKKNQGAIDTNRDATGNEIRGVQSQVDSANDDLLRLDEIQKEYGYQLVDVNGNIVDVQNDIIKNKKQQISDQKADLLERNSQEAAIQQSLREVGEQFADQYDTQSMFAEETKDAFKLSEEQILEVIQRQRESGVDLENVNANAKKQIKDVEDQVEEKQKYNQEYWANRLKILSSQGADAQTILAQEMSELKDKTYSGDTIVTAEDQDAAWLDVYDIMNQFNLDASPVVPKEYQYEILDSKLDEWVKSGLVKVERTVEGMLDEYTTSVYTLPDGKVITRKAVSPVITDSDGEEYRFGNDTSTLYIDGVPVGQKDGELESLIPQGKANHLDSTVMIGEDTNPNSPANRPDGGNQNNTGGQGQSQGNQSETPVAPSDPVVGEDIPLPDNLTDPDGTGAYGQNGQAFSLDGVTFWKRIKDRNGRWTYARLDSYQDNGTASRRAGLSNNVQNF